MSIHIYIYIYVYSQDITCFTEAPQIPYRLPYMCFPHTSMFAIYAYSDLKYPALQALARYLARSCKTLPRVLQTIYGVSMLSQTLE